MARRVSTRRRRKSNSNFWVVGGIVVIAIVAVALVIVNSNAAGAGGARISFNPPAAAALDKCGATTCGQDNAPVTIDVFADFQCPYCAQFEPVLQQLAGPYIDTGKVKLVYHNFTLIGPESDTAAQAALCAADQNKFWMFANDLFKHQGTENSGVFSGANLKGLAAAAGLNTSTFNSCLDSGKYKSTLAQSQAEGDQKGVKATPSFAVNGQMHEGGVTYDQLVALINAALPK